jgi:hypothetical protein
MRAYKLFRLRKDGSLGSLFINKAEILIRGVWLTAKEYPTKGYSTRKGWHTLAKPDAPHLKQTGRVWLPVEIQKFEPINRPTNQGGLWYIAQRMKILEG